MAKISTFARQEAGTNDVAIKRSLLSMLLCAGRNLASDREIFGAGNAIPISRFDFEQLVSHGSMQELEKGVVSYELIPQSILALLQCVSCDSRVSDGICEICDWTGSDDETLSCLKVHLRRLPVLLKLAGHYDPADDEFTPLMALLQSSDWDEEEKRLCCREKLVESVAVSLINYLPYRVTGAKLLDDDTLILRMAPTADFDQVAEMVSRICVGIEFHTSLQNDLDQFELVAEQARAAISTTAAKNLRDYESVWNTARDGLFTVDLQRSDSTGQVCLLNFFNTSQLSGFVS